MDAVMRMQRFRYWSGAGFPWRRRAQQSPNVEVKITAIKQQIKQKGRYSLFVDEKYSFSLSELGLINSGLRTGQEISKEELEKLKETSAIDKAYNRVLNLLARRSRSEWEIRDYLKRKGNDGRTTTEILNMLSNAHLMDDKAFARSWVESRKLLKPSSARKLRQELKAKRISDEIISEVLSEEGPDERETLRHIIERKRRQSKYQDDLKLMQYLARQGFNYDDIKTTLQELKEE